MMSQNNGYCRKINYYNQNAVSYSLLFSCFQNLVKIHWPSLPDLEVVHSALSVPMNILNAFHLPFVGIIYSLWNVHWTWKHAF